MDRTIAFIGAAIGIGAHDSRTIDAAQHIKNSPNLQPLSDQHITAEWQATIEETIQGSELERVSAFCQQLANEIKQSIHHQTPFCVIGGDHSCAIGTWSGAASAIDGDLGLIWIDAHMDAHTPDTSSTGNIHGMPVAALLGKGAKQLTDIEFTGAKIKPANICLIGIRSFEPEEEALLSALGVTIYDNEAVASFGINELLLRAHQHVTKNTKGFGISIDIDGIDPIDAPGTGMHVPNGIGGDALCHALSELPDDKPLLGIEIAEFNPHLDSEHKTEQLIVTLITSIFKRTNT
jgi:arginase